MLKFILSTLLLGTLSFGATSKLVNPGSQQIIDIGYVNPVNPLSLIYQKELISFSPTLTQVPNMIQDKARILSPLTTCKEDELGHENCPTQESTCNASVQSTNGISTQTTKTLTQQIQCPTGKTFNINTMSCENSGSVNINISQNFCTDENTRVLIKTLQGDPSKLIVIFAAMNPAMALDTRCGYNDFTQSEFLYYQLPGTYAQVGAYKRVATIPITGNASTFSAFNLNYTSSGPGCDKMSGIMTGSINTTSYLSDNITHCPASSAQYPKVTLTGSISYKDSISVSCPTSYHVNSTGLCSKTYSFYKYSCPTDTNIYGQAWNGPVKDSGGDCNGQCGAFGCSCNASTAPADNCVRSMFTCPTDPAKVCTKEPDPGASVNNLFNGFIYDNGTVTKNDKTVTISKTCDAGIYNPVTDKCEKDITSACFLAGFTYNSSNSQCETPLTCSGYFDNVNNLCETEPTHTCTNGTYNKSTMKCENEPICDIGDFNAVTNKCEYSPTSANCQTGYTLNLSSGICEKPVPSISRICDNGDVLSADGLTCSYPASNQFQYYQFEHCYMGYCAWNNTDLYGNLLLDYNTAYNTQMFILYVGSNYIVSDPSIVSVSTPTCSKQGTLVGGSCVYSPYCPSGTLYNSINDTCYQSSTPFIINSTSCPSGFNLSNGVCIQAGFNANTNTLSNMPICTGTYDVNSKKCQNEPSCQTGYTLSSISHKCSVDPVNSCDDPSLGSLIDSNHIIGTTQTCATGDTLCPSGSWIENGICVSPSLPSCPIGLTFDQTKNKCIGSPICPTGYTLSNNICKRDYTFYTYSCPTGFQGPLDAGSDCLGSCGDDGCSCNSNSAPGNNCKKPFDLNNATTTITTRKDLLVHNILGSGLTPSDYGNFNNYNCGDNCLFDVNKITGQDTQICFEKTNGQSSCFTVDGCSFNGTIQDIDSSGTKIIKDLSVVNQNKLALTSYTESIDIAQNSQLMCPNGGYTQNGIAICSYAASIKSNLTWDNCEGGSSMNVQAADTFCKAKGMRLPTYLETTAMSKDVPACDYNVGTWTGTIHYGPGVPNLSTSGAYMYAWKIGGKLFDIETHSTAYTRCVTPAPNYYCPNGGTLTGSNCYYDATCPNGYTLDTNEHVCKRYNYPGASNFITSTCKMNGHVGWHSRIEGISSIVADGDKLKFWDSYKDQDLGFIEFVKDVKEVDKNDGYLPEHILPYNMLANNFTAINSLNGTSYFVSSDIIDDTTCSTVASNNSLFRADTTVSTSVENFLKPLSGDRYKNEYINPECNNGFFNETAQACIKSLDLQTCSNPYDSISCSNTFINNNGIWDNSQGDNVNLYGGMYIPYTGVYQIHLETLGRGSFYIDGTLISVADYINPQTLSVSLKSGFHNLKIYGEKNTGSRGVALVITDAQNNELTNTKNWCKQPTSCNFPNVKIGDLCLETSNSYCLNGDFDTSSGKCLLKPKCILGINQDQIFQTQKYAVKTETSTANVTFKCSPLTCVGHQCQTADCPTDFDGKLQNSFESVPSGACREQSCDAFKSYYEFCGKQGSCDLTNNMVFVDNNICYERSCPNSQYNSNTGLCEKLACPTGTTENSSGQCVKK